LTGDEETGSAGAIKLAPALTEILGEIPPPRLAWLGEPTSYEVFRAHKGVVRFSFKVRGIGGHSSIPDKGVNAIAVAAKAIAAIGQYQQELRENPLRDFSEMFPESPYTTLNFGTISGGTASNVIAEQCSVDISYRQLPDCEPLEVFREIVKRIRDLNKHDYASSQREATIEFSEPQIVPALSSPANSPLERALMDVVHTGRARGALFATDGPQFAAVGIDSLICGPGELEQAHQPNESIKRSSYESGTQIVLSVLHQLCGAKTSAKSLD